MEFGEEIVRAEAAVCGEKEPFTEETYTAYREGEELFLEKEGVWRVFFRLYDRAGKTQVYTSEKIVIDRTAPEIVVSGVENGKSYSCLDHIMVEVKEENLSEEALGLCLADASGDLIKLPESRENQQSGMKIAVEELGTLPDGEYTVSIQAGDTAGNRAETAVAFRLNSTGSAYFLSSGARTLVEKYYVKEGSSFTLIEKNVDKIRKSAVTCVKNGSFFLLQEGKDYQVSCRKEAAGWRYEYLLFSKCFQEEGSYSVALKSEDEAGNQNDSRTMYDMEFFVDHTAPSSFLMELGEEVMAGTEQEIQLCARDEGKLKVMELWKDGKKVVSTGQEKLTERILLPEGRTEFQILARDFAGNQAWSEKYVVYVKAAGQQETEIPESGMAGNRMVLPALLVLWLLVLGIGIWKLIREK